MCSILFIRNFMLLSLDFIIIMWVMLFFCDFVLSKIVFKLYMGNMFLCKFVKLIICVGLRGIDIIVGMWMILFIVSMGKVKCFLLIMKDMNCCLLFDIGLVLFVVLLFVFLLFMR